ncbi:MAG: hypothetical protein WAQ33_04065 [Gaiellaceae bacterium]
MRTPAPFVLVAVVALAACGGGGSKGSVGGTLPSCATAGAPVQLPPELAKFPLPEGGVVDKTRKDAAGNTIYEGVVPGDIGATRDFYKAELPRRGYKLGRGDSEEHEAEADFSGRGADAHFKLHDISGCDGALKLEVALR